MAVENLGAVRAIRLLRATLNEHSEIAVRPLVFLYYEGDGKFFKKNVFSIDI